MKDRLVKALLGKSVVPAGLVELNRYFRNNEPINFASHPEEGGVIVAVSTNFRYGSIVAQGRSAKELDQNIKDAILTSFEVPSSYAEEAGLRKVGEVSGRYALA